MKSNNVRRGVNIDDKTFCLWMYEDNLLLTPSHNTSLIEVAVETGHGGYHLLLPSAAHHLPAFGAPCFSAALERLCLFWRRIQTTFPERF